MSRKNRVAHVSDLSRVSDVAARVANDIMDDVDRNLAEMAAEYTTAPQRLADYEGPAVLGWVVRYDGTGYRRCRVRIPVELLGEVSVGQESGPDHRSTQAAWITRELMTDETLAEIHREASKR